MQEKRNKRLAIALAVLTAAIAVLAFLNTDEKSFSVDKDLYKVQNLNEVERVVMQSGEVKTDLRYQGYRWVVNDTIPADRGLVEVLFATLQQAEPSRPVSTALRDSVSDAVRRNGVKVSLFSDGKEVQSFYAGGNEAKTQAIFMSESPGQPHIVLIPGYRVYVSGIFELPPLAWREKLVFNFQWQNFVRLEARYRNPTGDFDMLMEKNIISIPTVAEVDTAKVNTYLDHVSLLTVEEYLEPEAVSDSISASAPILALSVFDVANRRYELAVYNSGADFYGKINGKYWAKLNQARIVPLLRPKDFFAGR